MEQVNGLPGVRTTRTATPRKVLQDGAKADFLVGGAVIIGSKSRDSGNTGDLDVLRAGLLMGKVTASGKYAPSILGIVQSDYTSGATAITVSAAQAVEIVRRVGATGTLKFVGPPDNGGTLVTISKAYSAVDVSTGIITVTNLAANMIASSLVMVADGSDTIRSIIVSQFGIKVTDRDSLSIDVPWSEILIKGQIDASQIIGYGEDPSIHTWIKAALRAVGIGFSFDDDFIC